MKDEDFKKSFKILADNNLDLIMAYLCDFNNIDDYILIKNDISIDKIKILNEQIEQLEFNNRQNKDISKRLKNIEKIIYEEEQPIEEFDDVKFQNLVEKIIIGEKDIDSNVNPNTIRFVLKIGTEYKFKDLSFVPNKKTRNN